MLQEGLKEEEMLLEPKSQLRFQPWGANRIYIESEMAEAKQSEFIERECAGQMAEAEAPERLVRVSFIFSMLPVGGSFAFYDRSTLGGGELETCSQCWDLCVFACLGVTSGNAQDSLLDLRDHT